MRNVISGTTFLLMFIPGFFMLASASVASGVVGRAVEGNPPSLEKAIDQFFLGVQGKVEPGCVVGVFGQAETIFLKGYGMASLEQDRPIEPQSLFNLGSTSKQFTAAAIVMASLEGVLSLDDDVRKYIPELPNYGAVITIRHLVYHTSGIRDFLTMRWMAGVPPENVYSDGEVMDLIVRQEALNFAPGAHYSYSNSGYFLLAAIIKRATQKTLNEYSREKLFLPLGMKNTHFHDDRHAIHKNRTMAYLKAADGKLRLEWYSNFDKVGAGGLITSAEDLLLWEKNFHADQLSDGRLMPILTSLGELGNGARSNYGFGLIHGELGGLKVIKHRGAYMGYRAQIMRFPEKDISILVLCNLGNMRPERLSEKIAEILLASSLKEGGQEKEQHRAARGSSGHSLAEYAGSYQDIESRYILMFKEDNNKLQVLGAPFPLSLSSDGRQGFVADSGPLNVGRDVDVKYSSERHSFEISVGGLFTGEYVKVDMVSPSCDRLGQYRGKYYSPELKSVFRLSVQECQLFLDREGLPSLPLGASTRDAFRSGILALEFERDEGGYVKYLRASSLRVNRILFEKQPDATIKN